MSELPGHIKALLLVGWFSMIAVIVTVLEAVFV